MNLVIRNHHYILFLGILGSCVLLNSVLPFYLMLFYLTLGNFFLLFFNKLNSDDIKIYNISFSVSIFFYFISLLFLIYFNDDSQLDSDALNFFNLSTKFEEFDLITLRIFSEGSLAIIIWKKIYNFFEIVGFKKEFYVGIFFNIFLFSFSSFLILKISKLVNNMNTKKINNLIFFYSFSGLLIFFANSHIRDIFIFFFFNLMVYFFLYCKVFYKKLFIPISLILSVIFGIIFFYLRTEYLALPVLVFISFLIEKPILKFINSTNKVIPALTFLFICVISILFIVNTQIFEFLKSGYDGYRLANENVQSLNNSQSLATILIINQPLIIRYFLGLVYFIFNPIPFWSGFFSGSYYLFLKSLHVIMMYFLVPVFYLKLLKKSFYSKHLLSLFIIFFIGYSSIVLTSLELRHLGTFLGLFFILVSDFDFKSNKNIYKKTLNFFLLSILFVHLLWIIIKFI
jgi:hypothetical protein